MTENNILITGASSGLGAALARHYARAGAHLVLMGRNPARLDAVAADCRGRGARVTSECLDLRQTDELARRLAALDREFPFMLAIFNAGIGGAQAVDGAGEAAQTEEIATVNFTAPAMAATLLGEAMAARGRGHVVLTGSIAELFPLPMAPAYAGSKAGLAMFAASLRLRLEKANVAVTLVSPGFIDTPMSRSLDTPRPFLIGADDAARTIARRLARNPARIVLPWQFAAISAVAPLLPRRLVAAVLRRV